MTESTPGTSTVLSLNRVAELVGGRLEGEGNPDIHGISSVEGATGTDMALVSNARYLELVAATEAAAILTSPELSGRMSDPRPRVVVDEPPRAMLALLRHFHPDERGPAGIHPTAVLGRRVHIGEDVGIGAYAVLDDGVHVGDGTRIGPHVVVGRDARIGRGCTLNAQVVLYPRVELGDRCIVHSGARLGSDGFGYVQADGAHQKIPHVGRCVIGDDVEIGANTTIDRGSLGETRLGSGVKIDNLVQIGHNVRVGPLSMMAAQSGVAGSSRIGAGVWMGGGVGIINNLTVGDQARVATCARVFRDVKPGETVSGHPARPHREELRRQANTMRLPQLQDRVKALEEQLETLQKTLGT